MLRRFRTNPVRHALLLVLVLGLMLPLPSLPALAQTPDQVGEWGVVLNWGIQGKHMVLMHNGNILVWSTGDSARVWNPAAGTFILTPALFGDLHCAGQVTLADGRVMVIGGQNGSTHNGIAVNALFDPYTNSWTQGASMAYDRWYPTATTLPDGRVLATSGDRPDGTRATIPEIYDPQTNSWTQLTAANRQQGLYPLTFVLPDGRLYEAGTFNQTYFLNTATQTWTSGPLNTFGSDAYAESAVMYAPGKILRAGGGDPAFASAATIDLSGATAAPQWKLINSMSFPRRRHNLVLLADGQVMAVGGTRQADSDGLAVLEGEIWNPITTQWSTVAPMTEARMYHSSALLLPDGRILTAGGEADGRLHAQIYSPPYLFKGTRPTITSAPDLAAYGTTFTIETPNAATIESVALIRPSAVTHAFDMNQRYVPLTFSKTASGLSVTAPANGNIAPPGYYMLIIKDANGVPSVANWLRIDTAGQLMPGSISGRVTDKAGGQGVSGATVSYSGGSTTTAADGSYTLNGVLVGEHVVRVAAPGYATASSALYAQGGGAATLDFTLAPPATLHGTVTQQGSGMPIVGATITYIGGLVTTDIDGSYTINGIESGSRAIAVAATGYQSSEQLVDLPPNGTVTLDLTLTPKPTYIAGEVRNSITNEPIVGATVTYSGGAESATTDALGRYQLDNTPPGTHTVTVAMNGYIGASQSAVVTLGAYTITDFALDPTSAAPLLFIPTADSYTDAANPATNYGTAQRLLLDKDNNGPIYTSYLRFNVAGLSRELRSATLRLYVQNGTDKGGALYAVPNTYQGSNAAWEETALNQNNAPVLNGTPISTIGSAPIGTWVEFDVTVAITGNGVYSFALKPKSSDKVEYAAREDTVHAPQLVVRQVLAPPPQISSFSPTFGPAGTEVTIQGNGFLDVAEVAFNGQPASQLTVDSTTQMRAVVPAGATTGPIGVVAVGGAANSAIPYSVTVTPPPTTIYRTFVPLGSNGRSSQAAPRLRSPLSAYICLP